MAKKARGNEKGRMVMQQRDRKGGGKERCQVLCRKEGQRRRGRWEKREDDRVGCKRCSRGVKERCKCCANERAKKEMETEKERMIRVSYKEMEMCDGSATSFPLLHVWRYGLTSSVIGKRQMTSAKPRPVRFWDRY